MLRIICNLLPAHAKNICARSFSYDLSDDLAALGLRVLDVLPDFGGARVESADSDAQSSRLPTFS